jgi:Tfp pilus assembly protein PilX
MKGPEMRVSDRQSGSTLIMLIGVIAALAIMATSLVALVMNVSANTGSERTRAKAFNMAEAGLDNGLYVLSKNWPAYATSATPAIDETDFRTQFPEAEFPAPTGGGAAIDVAFYDNASTTPDPNLEWDSNGDKQMWVDARATVGDKTARVRALVQQENANLNLPRGVVIYAGGGLRMHGGGTPVSVAPGGLPPGSSTVTAWINPPFTANGAADFSSEVIRQSTGVPPVEEILDPEILGLLEQTAQNSGRYFTSVSAAEAAMLTGPLVYLKSSGNVIITANDVYNGDGMTVPSTTNPKPPGILIVDGGGVTFHGTGTFYGLVYCTSGFVDIGNATIKGMVISASGVSELGGSDQVVYDDRIIVQLNNVVTLAARIVPGTWRQLPTN